MGDLAYLEVLAGTGKYLVFMLRVEFLSSGLNSNQFLNFGCWADFLANLIVMFSNC